MILRQTMLRFVTPVVISHPWNHRTNKKIRLRVLELRRKEGGRTSGSQLQTVPSTDRT